jgi:hypothetical protein
LAKTGKALQDRRRFAKKSHSPIFFFVAELLCTDENIRHLLPTRSTRRTSQYTISMLIVAPKITKLMGPIRKTDMAPNPFANGGDNI